MRIYIWIKILPLLFVSCNSIINTAYDDTTARYNAYFLANESIEEIENKLDALDNDNTLSCEVKIERRNTLKQELDNYYKERARGNQIRSRAKWVEEGEKTGE